MPQISFIADQNKMVNVQGIIPDLTFGNIPDGVEIRINGVLINSGDVVPISADSTVAVTKAAETANVTFNYSNMAVAQVNGQPVNDGQTLTLTGNVSAEFIGAVEIPDVTVNGAGINTATINGVEYPASQLPITFEPKAAITNQVFLNGQAAEAHNLTIAGTSLREVTVNNVEVELPFKTTVTQDLVIAATGEEHSIDLTSLGGATITVEGVPVTDGTAPYNDIIKIGQDTVIEVDGAHELTIDGEYLKSVVINGIVYDVSQLPVEILDRFMTSNVVLEGYGASQVIISGAYLNDATADGKTIELVDGVLQFTDTLFDEALNVVINGAQPREYVISINNGDATVVEVDGVAIPNNGRVSIDKDTFISARPIPIPITVQSTDSVKVDINGREYDENEFVVSIDRATELDIYTATCTVTVSYPNDSYTMVLPQAIITLTAPQRDGWRFDSWSSDGVGFGSAKSVKTTIDLRGKQTANITAHYEQYITLNDPDRWRN